MDEISKQMAELKEDIVWPTPIPLSGPLPPDPDPDPDDN